MPRDIDYNKFGFDPAELGQKTAERVEKQRMETLNKDFDRMNISPEDGASLLNYEQSKAKDTGLVLEGVDISGFEGLVNTDDFSISTFDNSKLNDLAAERQTTSQKLLRTAANTLGNVPIGIIGDIGGTAAIFEDDLSNSLTRWAEENRDWAAGKVYTKTGDTDWYGNIGGGLSSAIQFGIEGALFGAMFGQTGAVVGKLPKLLATTAKLQKATKLATVLEKYGLASRNAAETALELSSFSKNVLAGTTKAFETTIPRLATATHLSLLEGRLSGVTVYDDFMRDNLQAYINKYEEQDGTKKAQEAASQAGNTTMYISALKNIPLNITGTAAAFKNVNKEVVERFGLNELAKKGGFAEGLKTIKQSRDYKNYIRDNYGYRALGEPLQEGLEETNTGMAEVSGRRLGESLAGEDLRGEENKFSYIDEMTNFGESLERIGTKEGAIEFGMGAVMGAVTTGVMDIMPRRVTENGESKLEWYGRIKSDRKEREDRFDLVGETMVKDLERIDSLNDELIEVTADEQAGIKVEGQRSKQDVENDLFNITSFNAVSLGITDHLVQEYKDIANQDNKDVNKVANKRQEEFNALNKESAKLDEAIKTTEQDFNMANEQQKEQIQGQLEELTKRKEVIEKDKVTLKAEIAKVAGKTEAQVNGYAKDKDDNRYKQLAERQIDKLNEAKAAYKDYEFKYGNTAANKYGIVNRLLELRLGSMTTQENIENSIEEFNKDLTYKSPKDKGSLVEYEMDSMLGNYVRVKKEIEALLELQAKEKDKGISDVMTKEINSRKDKLSDLRQQITVKEVSAGVKVNMFEEKYKQEEKILKKRLDALEGDKLKVLKGREEEISKTNKKIKEVTDELNKFSTGLTENKLNSKASKEALLSYEIRLTALRLQAEKERRELERTRKEIAGIGSNVSLYEMKSRSLTDKEKQLKEDTIQLEEDKDKTREVIDKIKKEISTYDINTPTDKLKIEELNESLFLYEEKSKFLRTQKEMIEDELDKLRKENKDTIEYSKDKSKAVVNSEKDKIRNQYEEEVAYERSEEGFKTLEDKVSDKLNGHLINFKNNIESYLYQVNRHDKLLTEEGQTEFVKNGIKNKTEAVESFKKAVQKAKDNVDREANLKSKETTGKTVNTVNEKAEKERLAKEAKAKAAEEALKNKASAGVQAVIDLKEQIIKWSVVEGEADLLASLDKVTEWIQDNQDEHKDTIKYINEFTDAFKKGQPEKFTGIVDNILKTLPLFPIDATEAMKNVQYAKGRMNNELADLEDLNFEESNIHEEARDLFKVIQDKKDNGEATTEEETKMTDLRSRLKEHSNKLIDHFTKLIEDYKLKTYVLDENGNPIARDLIEEHRKLFAVMKRSFDVISPTMRKNARRSSLDAVVGYLNNYFRLLQDNMEVVGTKEVEGKPVDELVANLFNFSILINDNEIIGVDPDIVNSGTIKTVLNKAPEYEEDYNNRHQYTDETNRLKTSVLSIANTSVRYNKTTKLQEGTGVLSIPTESSKYLNRGDVVEFIVEDNDDLLITNYEGEKETKMTWGEFKKKFNGNEQLLNDYIPIKVISKGIEAGYLHSIGRVTDDYFQVEKDSSIEIKRDELRSARTNILKGADTGKVYYKSVGILNAEKSGSENELDNYGTLNERLKDSKEGLGNPIIAVSIGTSLVTSVDGQKRNIKTSEFSDELREYLKTFGFGKAIALVPSADGSLQVEFVLQMSLNGNVKKGNKNKKIGTDLIEIFIGFLSKLNATSNPLYKEGVLIKDEFNIHDLIEAITYVDINHSDIAGVNIDASKNAYSKMYRVKEGTKSKYYININQASPAVEITEASLKNKDVINAIGNLRFNASTKAIEKNIQIPNGNGELVNYIDFIGDRFVIDAKVKTVIHNTEDNLNNNIGNTEFIYYNNPVVAFSVDVMKDKPKPPTEETNKEEVKQEVESTKQGLKLNNAELFEIEGSELFDYKVFEGIVPEVEAVTTVPCKTK